MAVLTSYLAAICQLLSELHSRSFTTVFNGRLSVSLSLPMKIIFPAKHLGMVQEAHLRLQPHLAPVTKRLQLILWVLKVVGN
jgi:hypothetical protein